MQLESESEVAQSYPTLCDPVDCSPPGSSICGILQARILEWVAISFSSGSSQPRDQTQVCRQTFYPLTHQGRILIPWPGIETLTLAVKVQSPNNWTAMEFPREKS